MRRRELLAAAAACAVCAVLPATADEIFAGDLTISDAFARASPMMAQAGAGFLTITNSGDADRLVGATSEVAEIVELHTHVEDNGMLSMRKVDAIDVPARGRVALKPGSFHIMFIKLKGELKQGERIAATLVFERAGNIAVTLPVKAAGAMN